MKDFIREAPLGQLVRWLTNNRVLRYPEEEPGFVLPETWLTAINGHEKSRSSETITLQRPPMSNRTSSATTQPDTRDELDADPAPFQDDLEMARTISRRHTRQYTQKGIEVEARDAIARTKSTPITPTETSDGNILVDWYTTDDPANPQNWSSGKKFWVSLVICIYTFVVYAGSAIYTTSTEGIMAEFGVTETVASLGLALYVLAYGLGPMVFAPMSEIPSVGRSPVYFVTFLIFVIVSIPAGFVNNLAGLLVLRFLQGFFGSPCLANGAATMQDIYDIINFSYALIAWVSAAYCGPALGPLLSGFAVTALGWRWSLYEIAIATGPVLFLMFATLPETSTPNLLLRRAQRLRKLLDNENIRSQSEIDQSHMKVSSVIIDAMIKPLEITIKDPAIAFTSIYTSLIYGIYYSFFEVFPLVYPVYYGFSIGMIGVVFTCVLVACLLGVAVYVSYLHFFVVPDLKRGIMRPQEWRLIPAIPATVGPIIGLFLFAWTARADVHWIVPTIGITIYGATAFVIMQCIFTYIPMSYPQYAASLFAANDFMRSSTAFGSILFARPLFLNLGVAKGVTLLAGLSTLGVGGMLGLYYFGARLRSRSKFAI